MEYSAGDVSNLLWFVEMRETVKLLQNYDVQEVQRMVVEENIYQQKAENRARTDDKGQTHSASSFFLEGVKVENASLKKKIEEVSSWSDDVDVILFNIDSKSATDSKMNKDAIKDVFMKVFNDYLGYCGSIPFLADFERKLDNDGRYEEFKAIFEEINGSSWVESREDFYFIQDEIIEAVVLVLVYNHRHEKLNKLYL